MGPECATFHKNIAEKIAYKTGDNYAKVQTFIRCKLSFIIIRSDCYVWEGVELSKPATW